MASALDFIEAALIERRRFLIGSALAAGSLLLPAGARRAFAASDLQLASSIRSLSNAFHVAWDKGSKAYADTVSAPYAALVTEGNSEKGIADIKAMLAKVGNKLVLGVDPNDVPDARPIVEAVAKAGAHVVTVWNKPDDLHPWDFGDNYVAHMSFNGVPAGEQTAKALFDSFGGEGGIVALGGIASNAPAIQRKQGLMNAIKANGKVELLDFQDADWDSTKANNVVAAWITRFGDKIKGIWAANDGMAVGALEALRAEGLAGKVLVTGIDGTKDAVTAIRNKEMAATVDWNPYWIGGIALSLGYHAATGAFSPSKEPKEHREFYGTGVLITQADVEAYWKANIDTTPKVDWNDLWGKVTGQITY
ncbi:MULTISPECIES: sugar ABC transporter substrate-binding protein [Labrys]|uniref:sugar ABC transporter substrate-binding protein n=1 Tax=Labrys TaxID=204476 RepID=UPI000830B911|nr:MULTISPECIES: sugar ABC transporter substrate-binding protein [unclassified Labrys (in: a-proteobacteria)]MDZ5448644.1 sugar ABC transporter substrate-binding protein [Labrys sp. ZIDIC5]OCC01872.1 LacI family transcriptional regulator [Labrys sp. WJW]